MYRMLAGLIVLTSAVPSLIAQSPPPGEPIRLTVHPAALPVPSLKYRLLPDRRDLVPGNAATLYYRSMAMLFENSALFKDLKEDHWDQWLGLPLKELPRAEVKEKLGWARHMFRELEQAAVCRDCNWQLEGRSEGIGLLLPEVQGFRRVAATVAVKARYEIAERQFPEALATLRVGYTFAFNLGKGPTLIHVLVGAAIGNLMNKQLDALVQQPGAPNLYWTLAVLPRPYSTLEAALQEAGVMLENTWPGLKRLENGPMTLAQVRALELDIQKTLDSFGVRRRSGEQIAGQVVLQIAAYPAAKKALVAQGLPADQVEAMPSFQVLALHALREYRQAWDELVKWAHVPHFRREAGYKEAAKKYGEAVARIDLMIAHGLLGGLGDGNLALENVTAAVGRIDRRFAALRCVEALRLYAAAHDGKLPAALKDITEVPVPVDPMTEQPFVYVLAGGRAKLSAPAPLGEKLQPWQLLTYEVTVQP